MNETEYLECACTSNEHRLVFTLDPEDEEFPIYVSTFLHSYYPWYKRIWVAIKYVFGYRSRYGHFDSMILGWPGVVQLYVMLSKVLRDNQKINEERSRNANPSN